ncbi:DUF4249 domain-containing protein [Dyadobacter sp. Leaf189]|uniref:DUF4249 domain-containing protein n=1 Tax=Dyadobacter sp. Leaf189 TaxID=1736295 RepID=UPI00138F98FF|nr:DUF4249 domain-containing protein [Dyadobacter sp. Leaf189]
MKRFLFLTLILFVGCREQDLNMNVPYSGDKLVLWGKLQANATFKLQVTKTFNPVGDIPKDVTVNNATVVLYKNGKTYLTLSHTGKEPGFYTSDSLIQAGASYFVQVSAPSLPTAESAVVTVPVELSGMTAIRTKNVVPQINHQTPQDLISLYFTKEDALLDKYFSIKLTNYYENDTLSSYPYASADNIPANEEDCHTWGIEVEKPKYNDNLKAIVYPQSRVFLMSNQCLPAPAVPVKFYVENGTDLNATIRALKVIVRVGVVSRDFFEYAKIENKQPEGVDHLVLPPQKALTNVKNGYGLIFASNEKTIELP